MCGVEQIAVMATPVGEMKVKFAYHANTFTATVNDGVRFLTLQKAEIECLVTKSGTLASFVAACEEFPGFRTIFTKSSVGGLKIAVVWPVGETQRFDYEPEKARELIYYLAVALKLMNDFKPCPKWSEYPLDHSL